MSKEIEQKNLRELFPNLKIAAIVLICIFHAAWTFAQEKKIPKTYSNIKYDKSGRLYLEKGKKRFYAAEPYAKYSLKKFQTNPQGTTKGLLFDFKDSTFNGKMYYGLINYKDSKHPTPVYFRVSSQITKGKAMIPVKQYLSGRYDMSAWEKSGKGTIGYRLLNTQGQILYDGIVSFRYTDKFEVDNTIVEGPFVNDITPREASLSFKTNFKIKCKLTVGDKTYEDQTAAYYHEFRVKNLKPSTKYSYTIEYGDNTISYSFKTAPKPGTSEPFLFAYGSDSRAGNGGGERNLYGVNAYVLKKFMALANMMQVAFVQFTGDLVNGYANHREDIELQYANWKRTVEPFAHYLPVYIAMGNHEALLYEFYDKENHRILSIDKFPFETESAEAVFAENFVNPVSSLQTEDGAVYDPAKNSVDFPPYKESVFSYTYDNVAMIVLNSNYLYSPGLKPNTSTSGNLHAYVMDMQTAWLEKTLEKYEKDKNIDHVFITIHTPFFPNGGHVGDDMWHNGDNLPRALINGKPLSKGIIEKRDELLDIIVNKYSKPIALLTGDEHNYNKVEITPRTNIYPENYDKKRIKLSRTIFQINNGAVGAPYYAQEQTPWTESVSGFTTQNAVVFIYIALNHRTLTTFL
ncbi:MAG: hypothetical protein CSA05_03310 [Bacteroidia bacterium]|nr:MAG: hypothetical protein CSA05_03310 [Bacteroidia bacterium]